MKLLIISWKLFLREHKTYFWYLNLFYDWALQQYKSNYIKLIPICFHEFLWVQKVYQVQVELTHFYYKYYQDDWKISLYKPLYFYCSLIFLEIRIFSSSQVFHFSIYAQITLGVYLPTIVKFVHHLSMKFFFSIRARISSAY